MDDNKVIAVVFVAFMIMLSVSIICDSIVDKQNAKYWKAMYEEKRDSYILFAELAIAETKDIEARNKLFAYLFDEFRSEDDTDTDWKAIKGIWLNQYDNKGE